MQDQWYGDNRDLVQWGTLLELARQYQAKHILQVLYYRPNEWNRTERRHEWERIEIHKEKFEVKKVDIAKEILPHFRDVGLIRNLKPSVPIEVLDEQFTWRGRRLYQNSVIDAIGARRSPPGIVFLDPDTGLEPPYGKCSAQHVLETELKAIWDALNVGDVLVFYQHRTNRNGDPFIEPKIQFVEAIGIPRKQARFAFAPKIARDVGFFFAQKSQ